MSSQTKIIGEVVYMNSGKKRAVGVEINAKGSSGCFSRGDGSFTLNFPHLGSGTTVYPKIEYKIILEGKIIQEIELVNVEKLEWVNIPEVPKLAPLKIIICTKGFRDLAAQKYYKILKTGARQKLSKKEKEIVELKRKLGESHDRVNIAQKELEYLHKLEDSLVVYKRALELASINKDDASDRINNYLSDLDAGINEVEAIEQLNFALAFGSVRKKGADTEEHFNEMRLVAKSKLNSGDFVGAIEKYDSITLLLSEELYNPKLLIDNLLDISEIHIDYSYNSKAIKYLKQAQKKLEDHNSCECRHAKILNLLGISLSNICEFEEAEDSYVRALELYKIMLNETQVYQADLASVRNNMGILFSERNQFEKAKVQFLESIELNQKIWKSDSLKESINLAWAIRNLGNFFYTYNQYTDAEVNFLDALNFCKLRENQNSDTYAQINLEINNDLGLLYSSISEYTKAENFYLDGLGMAVSLSELDSNQFMPYVAIFKNNLGLLYKNMTNYSSSEYYYTEALGLYQMLDKNNPERYGLHLANINNNIGRLYIELDNYIEAEINCLESLRIYKSLNERIEDCRNDHDLIRVYSNLGDICYANRHYSESENYYLEGLKIAKDLAVKNPKRYNYDVVLSLSDLGFFHNNKGDKTLAESYYLEALDLIEVLALDNPESYLEDLASVEEDLGLFYMSNDPGSKNVLFLEKALDKYRSLAVGNPEVFNVNTLRVMVNLSFFYEDINQAVKGEKILLEAMVLADKMKNIYPETFDLEYGDVLYWLGRYYLLLEQNLEAESFLFKSLSVYKNLSNDQDVILPEIANIYEYLGSLFKNTGDFKNAELYMLKVDSIYSQLNVKMANKYNQESATLHCDLGTLYAGAGEYSKAVKFLLLSLEMYREISSESPTEEYPIIRRIKANLAVVYFADKQYEKAERIWLEYASVCESLIKNDAEKNSLLVVQAYHNLGALYNTTKQYEKSEKAYNRALKFSRKLNDDEALENIASVHGNLGNLYLELKRFKLAERHYNLALSFYRSFLIDHPRQYGIEFGTFCTGLSALKKELFEKEYDEKLRYEGILLVNEGKEALGVFTESNPRIEDLLKRFRLLEDFFQPENKERLWLQKLKSEILIKQNELGALEKAKKKLRRQEKIISSIQQFCDDFPDNAEGNTLLSKNYGTLAWYALVNKKYTRAENYSKMGIMLDSNNVWINTNLVLAFLLQNEFKKAKKIYLNLMDKPYGNSSFSEAFLEDIENLEKEGIEHKDFSRIRQLLKK